jgi:hypothetical protein
MAMSDEHKEALARGRNEARAIKRYLESLQSRKRGRPVRPETQKKRIADLNRRIDNETDLLKKVHLTQQRIDAEAALSSATTADDRESLERDFVRHAKDYSERKGISYAAWREGGVPPEVLKKAGIKRTRRAAQ